MAKRKPPPPPAPAASERGCVSAPVPGQPASVPAPVPGERGCVSAPVPSPPSPPSDSPVLQVKTWIVEGQQAADILESIKETYPSHRPEILLSTALEQLGAEYAELDKDVAKGFLLNAYREIYRRAYEINDFPNALAALRAFERHVK